VESNVVVTFSDNVVNPSMVIKFSEDIVEDSDEFVATSTIVVSVFDVVNKLSDDTVIMFDIVVVNCCIDVGYSEEDLTFSSVVIAAPDETIALSSDVRG